MLALDCGQMRMRSCAICACAKVAGAAHAMVTSGVKSGCIAAAERPHPPVQYRGTVTQASERPTCVLASLRFGLRARRGKRKQWSASMLFLAMTVLLCNSPEAAALSMTHNEND